MKIFKTSFGPKNLLLTASVVVLFLFGLIACQNLSAQSRSSSSNSNSNSGNSSRGGNSNSGNGNNSDSEDNRSDQDYYRWGYRSAVGGFSIDAGNAFRTAEKEEMARQAEEIRSTLEAIPADLDQPVALRKISLKRLAETLKKSAAAKTPVPDSVRYLGGLTGIEYVVAAPEENDIYLAGPAEGWTVAEDGSVVGRESGKPILLLEDLVTVFRAWNTKTPEVITCSIDPTPEAIQRFANLPQSTDPEQMMADRVEAMGPMNVSFSGIPAASRMAWTLAAADYRMKTISLGFEEAPIAKFPSYFGMIKRPAGASFGQRFWIAPEYGTLRHDSKELVWNLTGTEVKTLTEREYFNADGSRKVSGKKDAAAQKWADLMTKRYADLAKAAPIFGEAKNCMDIALTVALIYFRNLPQKAGCSVDFLSGGDVLPAADYSEPEKVPSLASCRAISGGLIAVTGGVSINPFETVEKNVALDADLDSFAEKIAFSGENWWAN